MAEPFWEPLAAAPTPTIYPGQDVGYAERTTNLPLPVGTWVDMGLSVTFVAEAGASYWVENFWPLAGGVSGNAYNAQLYVDGVQSGFLMQPNASGQIGPLICKRKLSGLSAGSHTITLQATGSGGGSPLLQAGTGVGAAFVPAYLRVSKA
jgi:hypothetical protein